MVKEWNVKHENEMEDEERETGDAWWKCEMSCPVHGGRRNVLVHD